LSARTKLNWMHGVGTGVVALMLGAVLESWLVFWLAWGGLLMLDVSSGNIRPERSSRGGRRRRRH
jgi:hypothetical protein